MNKLIIMIMRFSVMNIAKRATAEKCDTNIRAETLQYSYDIHKNWVIRSLNILINNILEKIA